MRSQRNNDAMRRLLERAGAYETLALDPELRAYVREGLAVDPAGAIVSVAAARQPHTARAHFGSLVEYEAFVNKLHLDDWMSESRISAPLEEKLGQALLLADAVGELAEQCGARVAVVISADISNADVVFRFHGVRHNESPWVPVDLEGFLEPVLERVYGGRIY